MNFFILDPYTNNNWRLVKDTAGGYGTGNDFGDNILAKGLNKFVSKMISMPPMYSMYVFSILKNMNFHVEYSKEFEEEKIKKADYIILTSSIICHETEIETLKKLVSLKKKTFVIGIFGNVMKDKYSLKNTYIVKGEPEQFFSEIDFDKNNLDNFFNNNNEKITTSVTVENLDSLPFPDWKYYSEKYDLKNNFLSFNSKIAVPIVATRGCPYSCFNYCTYPLQQGRKVRMRSVKNVVDEMKYWIYNLKTNKFIFRDPVFSINRKYTVELCKAIIDENLKINFLIETHLKNLDDELIDLLKKAGLVMVYVGIESSNSDVLGDIKRFTINNDDQYKIVKKLVDKNIYVKSMFMFGNPGDNETTIKKTIEYSAFLPNQFVQYSVFTPYPGTPIYSLYEKKVVETKYEKFNQYNLVYKHENLDNLKITKLKNFAYRKFYLRPSKFKIIAKSLLSLAI
jgi:anaerobic magnesium-protoporphyrin IX monomethyl ester cyclase